MNFDSKLINDLLVQDKLDNRKSINMNINEELLNRIDESIKLVSESTGQFISRNRFLEFSAQEKIEELENEISKLQLTSNKEVETDQVIIFTASQKNDNYNKMYLNTDKSTRGHHWDCVFLGNKTVDLINKGYIKYFSLYRGKPYQCVDSYAVIKGIERILSGPKKNKYIIYLENPVFLKNPVKIGTAEPSSIMKGKKTNLSKLLKVSTIDQL